MIFLYISIATSIFLYAFIPLTTIFYERKQQFQLKKMIKEVRALRASHFRGYPFSNSDRDKFWLQIGGESLVVSLKEAVFFRLESYGDNLRLRRINLNEFIERSEGASIDVLGYPVKDRGILSFKPGLDVPLMVILNPFENLPWEDALDNALSGGHFFHSPLLTRSIMGGTLLSIFYLSLSVANGMPPGFIITNLILALFPLFPVIPPGIFFFIAALAFWKRQKQFPALISFLLMIAGNCFVLFQVFVMWIHHPG